jgi:hypothetical protein
MTKIVDLEDYKRRALEKRSFAPWKKRFKEKYSRSTTFADISDRTLYFLAKPGEESAMAFYDLIMGTLNLGLGTKFYYLEKHDQLKVMDIHLFLADQSRFEMMRRIDWVDHYPARRFTIVKLIEDYQQLKTLCRKSPPMLSKDHPDYQYVKGLVPGDKESFVRRLLPSALENFIQRLN